MFEWSVGAAGVVVLFVAVLMLYGVAVTQIVRRVGISTTERVAWIAITLVVPLFGAVAWFLIGRDGSGAAWVRKALNSTNS